MFFPNFFLRCRKKLIFAHDIRKAGRSAAPKGEESPDRKGHPAAEIADGSNLIWAVTENNRRASGKGENVGQEPTTVVSDGIGVRPQGLQDQIY